VDLVEKAAKLSTRNQEVTTELATNIQRLAELNQTMAAQVEV
jgi:hypothetical protein